MTKIYIILTQLALVMDLFPCLLEAIEDINTFVVGFTFEQFVDDKKTVAAVVRNLEIIGEAARILSEKTQNDITDVPWHKIRGLRNRVIHEYFNVSHEIVWHVIQHELLSLQKAIEQYLANHLA